MNLGTLVKEYRTNNSLTMEEFAKKCGLSKGYISMLEKNQNPKSGKPIIPTLETIKLISNAMGEDFNEIISILDGNQPVSLKSKVNCKNLIPLSKIKTKKVPLIGSIACGAPITAVENIEEYIDMDADIHADFALRCKGDSMINARIFDGDIVYIREQPMVENGEIAAVIIDDMECEATLKRVYIDDEHIILHAENPVYKDMAFYHEEMNQVRIVGKAVAFLSAVK